MPEEGTSLDAIYDSVVGKMDGNSQPAAPSPEAAVAPTQTPVASAPAAEQAPAEGEGQAVKPITLEQPQGASEPAKDGIAWKPAEGVSPDTVIAFDGDKPVTVKDVEAGFLRQADYTRKTQELATVRQEVAPVVQFIEDNRETLEAFDSGDKNRIAGAIEDLAKMYGVLDLVKPAQASGPQRGPDGRFLPSQGAPTDGQPATGLKRVDLDEYEEGTAAYEMGQVINSLLDNHEVTAAELAAQRKQWDELMTGVTSEVEQERQSAVMQKQADEWKSAGFTQVDTQGAQRLIGKPITAEQAMWLHHMGQILEHNAGAASKAASVPKPNEPGGVDVMPKVDPKGKSLTKYIDELMPA